MKTLITFIIAAFSFLAITPTFAQGAVLQFDTELTCQSNQYCATLQIKSSSLVPFKIGTSSIFFDYNREALEFKTYKSLNFDEKNTCEGLGDYSPYKSHQYDEEYNGKFNTTITLDIEEAACLEIENTFIDVAEICFEVTDPFQKSNLHFAIEHTNFNQSANNGELIDGLEFINKTDDLSCNANATGIQNVVQNDFDLIVNNPVVDVANLQFESTENQLFVLEVYELSGKKIESKAIETQIGTNFESINMSSMSQGIYVVQLTSKGRSSIAKVFKN